jgi:hypothetical protein
MSAEEAARLGVFVTALSKSHADGVGGPTAAVLGLNSESTWKCYQPEDIAEIERTLSLFELESSLQEFWNQRNREVRKTSVFRNLEREQKNVRFCYFCGGINFSLVSSLIMRLSVSPVPRFDLVSSAEARSQQQP